MKSAKQGQWLRNKVPVLLIGTMLAGIPASALAQGSAQPVAAPVAVAPAAETIRQINVVGSQRLEPITVISYTRLRVGDAYTAAAGDQALKDLYATELFSNVSIGYANGVVTIEIVENPIVNRIVLEGNKRVKNDKILPEIKLSPREIYTRSKVRADVARIIELYRRQGRYAATVDPKRVDLDQNRVDVVFEIDEGPKSKVRQINIIGNEAFSDGRLRGEMVTKEARFYRIFSSGTSYDPDRLAFDQQKMRQFYLTQGYADFRVVSAVAELTPDKQDFIITYVVEEGERYKFGPVTAESNLRDFPAETVQRLIPMKEGEWFNAKRVEDTTEAITETAGLFGYAFANVEPEYKPNREALTMGMNFKVGEAQRVYVERVDINGNTFTEDKVIRREMRLAEGDAFNSINVKRSAARINSLGYFQDNLEIEQKPGSAPDRIILEANVQEKSTGELALSAGYSSLERFLFQASIAQPNFRGKGQMLRASIQYSQIAKSAELSFTEPYLFDSNIQLGGRVFRQDSNYFNYLNGQRNTTYRLVSTGVALSVGVPLTEFMSIFGRYTLSFDNVTLDKTQFYTNGACDPLLASRYLCDVIGKRTTSTLGATLVYDDTNNRLRPTRGQRVSYGVDFAGLGGNVKYIRANINVAKFWHIGSGFVFSVKGEGGHIRRIGGQDIRLNDRYYLGEPQIRGFDIRGVGPRVIRTPYGPPNTAGIYDTLITDKRQIIDDATGGTTYYLGRAEIEIPLGEGAKEMGIRPSVFVDVGSVWGGSRPALTVFPDANGDGYPEPIVRPVLYPDGTQVYQVPTTETTNAGLYTPCATGYGLTLATCTGTSVNTATTSSIPPFKEEYVGDTWKPRVTVGIGANWNSPFGPFRIDFGYAVIKRRGDDTKKFTFNVGTAF